jgi:hypothetical protein
MAKKNEADLRKEYEATKRAYHAAGKALAAKTKRKSKKSK